MTRVLPILAACVALGCGHGGAPTGPIPPVPPNAATPAPKTLHAPCPAAGCPPDHKCLEYCGVAGCTPQTTFRTCEIPCASDDACPPFLACRTIADGPGRVRTETR